VRPGWINILLFMLTQRVGCGLVGMIALISVWWYLADYYLVQLFDWWPAWAEFALTTFVVLILLSLGVVLTRKQVCSGLPADLIAIPANAAHGQVQPEVLRSMLLYVLPRCSGLARRYVAWLEANTVGPRVWILGSWILFPWLFLATPLHSVVMEKIASQVVQTPSFICCLPSEDARAKDEIFNIRVSVPDVGAGRSSTPVRLEPTESPKTWRLPTEVRPGLAVNEQGTIQINVGDFPHLHRRALMRCSSPDCGFPGLPDVKERTSAIRAGTTAFEFNKNPNGKNLNATLLLLTRWGHIIGSAEIEPKGEQNH
jgi:hypothetical protein